jgi:Flp pilus assembly pilin Flp
VYLPLLLMTLPARLRLRLPAIPDRVDADEDGAQVAEYAMLAGVGAAACAALVALLKSNVLKTIVEALVGTFVQKFGTWF